jgi:nucleotide-binding universal stress UspA family protein
MKMKDKIGRMLVAIDGSTKATEALKLALYLANSLGAEVEIFHVIPSAAPALGASIRLGGAAPGRLHDYDAEQRAKSEKLIQEATDESKKGYPQLTITSKILEGDPASTILEESENNFDVIVLGHHGHSHLNELILGSVSEKVIHKSKITVILST